MNLSPKAPAKPSPIAAGWIREKLASKPICCTDSLKLADNCAEETIWHEFRNGVYTGHSFCREHGEQYGEEQPRG